MAIMIKCKMCGGDLELVNGSSVGICIYCGTQQTVPAIDDDKKTRLYNRANQYRMDSEFDKAYAAYESIANDQPDEAEAYWGMLLCEYGVEYVDDPKNGKKIPTCHRTLVHSIFSNSNYKSACQYADPESRIMYEDEAATLDALQKRVLNASAKEEAYDVFICYKETDDNGNRTADSVMAQDIYDSLTAKGIRVFFSRISLEDKLGQDYEPCIFAALNSAKVMLMVTADSDHCNSVWVKNEWKRYLDFMKNDTSKTLIPVYRDISPYTLPDEFSHFQAQDMSKLGAIQDLTRGVEKLLGKSRKPNKSGMNDDEKKAFNAMVRGQRNSRFLILAFALIIIGFFVAGLAVMMPLLESPAKDWVFITTNGGTEITFHWIDWYSSAGEFLVPLCIVLPFVGTMAWVSHGITSTFSRWIFALKYFVFSIFYIVFQLNGSTIGTVLWIYLAVLSAFAILSTFLAYRNDKKRMNIHFLSMAIVLAVTLVTGLF